MPSPDPSADTVFGVRAVRVACEDAVFRRVDVDVVDPRAVDFVPVDATAAVGFAEADREAAGFAAAGFAAAGFALAGFARVLERAGDAARADTGRVADRVLVAGLSSLIWAVSWTTTARASDACFFRFASTSRAFWRRFSSRANLLCRVLGRALGACSTG